MTQMTILPRSSKGSTASIGSSLGLCRVIFVLKLCNLGSLDDWAPSRLRGWNEGNGALNHQKIGRLFRWLRNRKDDLNQQKIHGVFEWFSHNKGYLLGLSFKIIDGGIHWVHLTLRIMWHLPFLRPLSQPVSKKLAVSKSEWGQPNRIILENEYMNVKSMGSDVLNGLSRTVELGCLIQIPYITCTYS